MRIHRAFTLLRRKTSNKKQDLTNVAEAQQILLQELNLSAQAGPPSSRDRLRILHYLTVTERKISISRGLEIKHLDQAEKYVNKALNLTPLSGMAGAQEQLAIERFIINGLRAILGFQKGTENAESKQTLLRNTIAGMSQAWENLEKVDKVIFEKNRNFVRKWIHEFMAA